MDKLANEDHNNIATEEEIDVYRGNWWIRSNFVGSDMMPVRHRPDFKKALSTLHRLRRTKRTTKIGRKAPPRGGDGKLPGGIHHLRHHRDDGLDTDRTGKPEKSVKRLFMCGMSLTKNLVQNYSSLSPTVCKEYIFHYRKVDTKTVSTARTTST